MRKMLLICAATLGVAGITSAATSANIVGYSIDGGSKVGFRQIAPPFISVLDENQMFTLDRITGNFQFGDTLQFIDGENNTDDASTVTWVDEDFSEFSNQGKIGWHDENLDYVGNIKAYIAGTGILVLSDALADVTVSGEVNTMPMTNYVNETGFYLFGNSAPVTNKLENIVFKGLVFGDTLQFIAPDNNTDDAFTVTWVDEDFSEFSQQGKVGWHDENLDYVGDIRYLLPGQGFTLLTDSDDVEIVVSAPVIN